MEKIQAIIIHTTLLTITCAFLLCSALKVHAQQTVAPNNSNSTKTVAYLESGSYWEFPFIFEKIIDALKQKGLLNRIKFPKETSIKLGWTATNTETIEAAKKIMNDPAVDVILCMGISATMALIKENNGKTPILAINVALPRNAGYGIQRSEKGIQNLNIRYIRGKWYKVFELFYDALPFKKLGIMFNNSTEGVANSNANEAREIARERGFQLIEYPYIDKEESQESCAKGIKTLISEGIDSFYISELKCFDTKSNHSEVNKFIKMLNKNKIKIFAGDGSRHAKSGAIMGLSTLDYTQLGDFYADRIALELGLLSEKADLIKETYTPKITLNLVTANTIGIDIPLNLLITADEIFDSKLADVQNPTMANGF